MFKKLLVSGLFSGLFSALFLFTAIPSQACDPVWGLSRPVYKQVKGRRIQVSWTCDLRAPNGKPERHGSGGHGG